MINGGLHGAGNLDFQEFLVIPASSKPFSEGLRSGVEIYMTIGENLSKRGAIHSVGHEGGYAPNLFTNADAMEIIVEAVRNTGYQMGRDIFLGLDVAATTFYQDNSYKIRDKSGPLSEDTLIEYYKELNDLYHFAILEDALHQDAWEGWVKLRQTLGDQVPIVGDDLLATNVKRVQKAVSTGACNAILVKPNQIGTVSETLEVIKSALDANWKVVVSHRSGETNDHFIADFAVGVGADYAKFGAPARGERVSKYNRLLSIEQELTSYQSSQQNQ
jgi:enolase